MATLSPGIVVVGSASFRTDNLFPLPPNPASPIPVWYNPTPAPRQADFQFPNLALPFSPPVDLTKIFRPPLFTYKLLPVRNLDFAFPNLSILAVGSLPVPIITQQALELDRPPPPVQKQDFAFPNVALQAFAQLAVKPVGAVIDETVPSPQPRQLDFQFPNIANPPTTAVTRPVGGTIDETVPVKYRTIDWQFPNVALQAFAQLAVHPVGAAIDETVPSPQARQLDFQFPNVANPPTRPPADLTKIFRPPLFNRPVVAVLPVDVPIPNLLTTTLTTPVVKPIIPQPFSDRPTPQQRVQEFVPPNLSITAAAQAQVHPVGGTIDETVPQAAPHQLDFAFPNVTLPNSAAPTLPVGKVIDETVPRVDPRQLDFQFPNIPALNFAQLQVKPVGSELDESVPAPQPRQIDFAFPNVAGLVAKVKPFSNQFFDRPVATQIQTDAPIPNLLTTTLFVAPAQPIFNPIFERPQTPALPQDNVPPNLLVTILSTPVGIPFLPNISLMTDRPSPRAPSLDQFPVNLTINLPPPPATTELHQNPFFITMGRLSQLGNLPS